MGTGYNQDISRIIPELLPVDAKFETRSQLDVKHSESTTAGRQRRRRAAEGESLGNVTLGLSHQ